MQKAYQYRLYPTNGQARILNRMLEGARWVYNETLATRKRAWEERQEQVGLYATINLLPRWKAERPSLKIVHSQVLQNVCVRVDLAFKAFFRRVKTGEKPGYPRFKGQGRYDSLTYPQYGTGARLDGRHLILSKIGSIKVVLHRPIAGTIKTVTIRRTATGKWFACLSVEITLQPQPVPPTAVGVDVGLEAFATFSTGEQIANPRFLRKDERALAKAQQRLSKTAKGTPERHKRRKAVAHIHERIANRRRDFAHQQARKLVRRFGTICIEDLNTQGMLKNRCLAKSIADAAWSQFAQVLTSKAVEAGGQVVQVDPRNTSTRCTQRVPGCGQLVAKDLSVRIHSCPVCGLEINRDLNAAINILALGLQRVGATP
jgi:putative transposase